MRSIMVVVTMLIASMALAGCTGGEFSNSPEGQSASTAGSLSYNGASTGSHTSQPVECDGDGNVNVNYNLGSGGLSVQVKDGNGAIAWTKQYEGTGQKSDTQTVSGAAGDWTVTVTRTTGLYGSFSGQYNVNLSC